LPEARKIVGGGLTILTSSVQGGRYFFWFPVSSTMVSRKTVNGSV